jgi:murein DD-endopeptidase MepM/ murein hydrolase activator NlpD
LAVVLVAVPVALQGNAGASLASPQLKAVACDGGTYTVVSGDSWYRIASKLKLNVSALLTANSAVYTTMIHPGDVLCLPAGAATTTSAAVTTTTATPASTATTTPTTVATKPVTVTIRQFPVQGVCYFIDTWGAPRSGGRKHQGVDILAKTGRAVYAVDDGTLTKQYLDTPGSLSGNGWRLTRADGTYFFYAHFSRFADGLRVGSTVKAGQIIGYVGMTGNAGAPHLHFEVHPGGGAPVNPTPVVEVIDGCAITALAAQPSPTTTNAATTTTVKPTTTTAKPTATTVKPTTTTAKPTTTTAKPTTTTTVKPTTTTAAPVPAATKWQWITPVMALNTVLEGRRLAAGVPTSVTINGLAGVDSATSGVMLRIVARNITAAGTLTLHACGTAPSRAPTLSFAPTHVGATVASVPVGKGTFCITSTVPVDLRVAVVGQKAATGTVRQGLATPVVIDSGTVAAGTTRSISPPTMRQPSGAQAVQLTITLKSPNRAGSFGIGSCGGTPWIVAFPAAASQTYTVVVRTNSAGVCFAPTVDAGVTVRAEAFWVG